MNRIYRIVWNEAQGAWVAVTEIAKGRGPRAVLSARSLRRMGLAALAASGAAALAAPPTPAAPAPTTLPTGGQVVAGQAGISQSGATLTVQQASQRAAIDWQRFDIGRDATVRFAQPGRDAVTLNRVLDNQPSRIFGRIQADGQVFLSNPSGVYFAPGASADVGGLVATTMAIGVDEFMAGSTTFGRNGSTGAVVNEGTLQARYGGYIALLAPEVVNSGLVLAQAGTVALGAGEAVELQFAGGQLAKLRVEPATVAALIENRQAAQAPDGIILMSARAAQALGGSVIRHSGELAADSLQAQGGRIVLEADRIELATGSRTSATGATGGGDIRIGGGWQGSGDTYQAREVLLDAGASVDASATGRGNGGSVVLWSDIHNADSRTGVFGRIAAQGGAQGGNGGRIETSGHAITISGSTVDASAPQGKGGEWLIDPYDMTISSSAAVNNTGWASIGTGSNMWVGDLQGALNSGNSITVRTGSGGSERGDITVNAAITKSSGSEATLTFEAANSIIVNQPISATNGTRLNVVFDADNNNGARDGAGMTLLAANVSTGGGALSFGTGATLSLNGVNTLVGGDVYLGSGASTLATGGGALTVNGQMLIANPSGVTITTGGGAATFHGAIDSANSFSFVNSGAITWVDAFSDAKNGTAGGAAVGDSYLATLTSRAENMIGSQVANYAESWLGARRSTTANAATPTGGADNTWRWIAGPEGQAEGGQGKRFYEGRDTSGAIVTGAYSNWSSSEPNDFNPGESAAQFIGNFGQWNDMPANLAVGTGYLRETNLAGSPLTVNAGSGQVSFLGKVGGQKALGALTVTGSKVTIAGGGVRTEGAQTYNAPIELGAGATVLERTATDTDFTLPVNQTITYTGNTASSLTLLATRNIFIGDGTHITSQNAALDVVLNSDSDRPNAAGRGTALAGGAVVSQARLVIDTHGGDLMIGGGDALDGSGMAIGVASGNDFTRGIFLRSATVNAGGGHIELRGTGSTADGEGILIQSDGGQSRFRTTGSGHITMEGIGGAAGTPNAWTTGVALEMTALQTDSGAITLTGVGGGYGSSSPVNQSGVRFANAGINSVVSASGPITITGTMGSPTSWATNGAGIEFATATSVGNGNGTAGTVSGSTADISLTTDNLSVANGTAFSSSGTLTVAPLTASTSIGVAGAAGTLQLIPTFVLNGFERVVLGRTDGTGTVNVNAMTVNDSLTLQSGTGAINLLGVLNAGTNNVTLRSDGTVTAQGSTGVQAASLGLQGNGSFNLTGSANAIGTVAGSVGTLNLQQADGLTIGTVEGVTGLTGTGTLRVDSANGDLNLAGSVSTSATGNDAVTLNAGSATAAGVATGGNITATNGVTVSVGSGGRATLYTGSVANSTGLEAVAGSGSGRFRYGSDESTTQFSRALGSGVNVVYREQPLVTLQASNGSSVYGQAVAGSFSGSGYANGDNDANALTGTASYQFSGGPRSTSGAFAVGTHQVALSGLASDLGYAVQTAGGSWTVTPATLSAVSGITAQDKVYNGLTTASLDLSGAQFQGMAVGDELTLASASGQFADKNVGNGKTVGITGLTLGGADAGNYVLASSTASTTASITPASISVSGITAQDRVYNGSTVATVNTSGAQLQGLVNGDSLTVANASGRFADKNVGQGKTVTITGVVLVGDDVANYVLAAGSSTATASITPAALTAVTGITAQGKVYDGNTAATLNTTGAQFQGLLAGDVLSVAQANGRFADKNAGRNKTVAISGLALGGTDAGNYVLASTTGTTTASITPAQLTAVSGITAQDKVYDAGTAATLNTGAAQLQGVLGADTVLVASATGRFADKNVASGKTVTVSDVALGGADAGNYVLASNASIAATSASITPAALSVAGRISARNRVEDGTTTAQVDLSGVSLSGVASGDTVTLTTGPARFDSAQQGNGRTVTVAGLALAGADAANYRLSTEQLTTTADLYAAPPLTTPVLPPVVVPTPPVVAPAGLPAPVSVSVIAGSAAGVPVGAPAAAAVTASPAAAAVGAAGPAGTVAVTAATGGTASAGASPAQPATASVSGGSGSAGSAAPGGAGSSGTAGGGFATPSSGVGAQGAPSTVTPATPSGATPAPQGAGGTPSIAVQLVQAPGTGGSGVVTVSVPQEVLRSGNGFSFPLPDALQQPISTGATVSVSTAEGRPLPAWLRFDAASGRFIGQQVPEGALPLQVQLVVNGQRTVMSIAQQSR